MAHDTAAHGTDLELHHEMVRPVVGRAVFDIRVGIGGLMWAPLPPCADIPPMMLRSYQKATMGDMRDAHRETSLGQTPQGKAVTSPKQ